MKTRRRIRGTIKWGGAVVTVLLLIVCFVGTGYTGWFLIKPIGQFGFWSGQMVFIWPHDWSLVPPRIDGGITRTPVGMKHEWWFRYEADSLRTGVFIPQWFCLLLFALPTALIWRRDRKALSGTCPKCGYSRTGLPADRACPECGTHAPQASS